MATKDSKDESTATGPELLEDIDALRLRQGVSDLYLRASAHPMAGNRDG